MKVKKENKFKLFWSKIKRPLMVLSVIGNILFILSLFVGCSNMKRKTANEVGAVDTYQRHTLQGVTDLNGLTLYMPAVPFPYGKMSDYYNWTDAVTKNLKFHIANSETNYLEISAGGQDAVGNYYTTCYNLTYWKGTNHNIESNRFRVYGSTLAHNDNNANPLGWLNDDVKVLTFFTSTNSTNSSTIDFLDLMGMTLTDPNAPQPEPDTPTSDYEVLESIYLGDNFIPTSYVTQNGNYIFSGFAGKNNGATAHTMVFEGFEFLSNGKLFNRIKFIYAPLNAVTSRVTQDGVTLVDTTSYGDYMSCIAIKYEYMQNNNSIYNITVCSPRRAVIVENSTNYNVYDVRPPFNVWLTDNYRTIDVISNDNTIISDTFLQFENMSAVELLKVTTNVAQEVMGTTNVFSLLGGAFAGLAALFSISLLPGITLGLLLFLPLIVIIIITIVRLVKK